jgi:hypothetical protein
VNIQDHDPMRAIVGREGRQLPLRGGHDRSRPEREAGALGYFAIR